MGSHATLYDTVKPVTLIRAPQGLILIVCAWVVDYWKEGAKGQREMTAGERRWATLNYPTVSFPVPFCHITKRENICVTPVILLLLFHCSVQGFLCCLTFSTRWSVEECNGIGCLKHSVKRALGHKMIKPAGCSQSSEGNYAPHLDNPKHPQ